MLTNFSTPFGIRCILGPTPRLGSWEVSRLSLLRYVCASNKNTPPAGSDFDCTKLVKISLVRNRPLWSRALLWHSCSWCCLTSQNARLAVKKPHATHMVTHGHEDYQAACEQPSWNCTEDPRVFLATKCLVCIFGEFWGFSTRKPKCSRNATRGALRSGLVSQSSVMSRSSPIRLLPAAAARASAAATKYV